MSRPRQEHCLCICLKYQHYGYISSQWKYPQQSDSISFKRPSRHAPDLGVGFREGDHITPKSGKSSRVPVRVRSQRGIMLKQGMSYQRWP